MEWDNYEAEDFVSMDKFVVQIPDWQLEGCGQEGDKSKYHRGTIFNDTATGIIWVKNQITLGARDTLIAKQTFKDWLWDQVWVEIKHIHSNNDVFTEDEFQDDSGVGA